MCNVKKTILLIALVCLLSGCGGTALPSGGSLPESSLSVGDPRSETPSLQSGAAVDQTSSEAPSSQSGAAADQVSSEAPSSQSDTSADRVSSEASSQSSVSEVDRFWIDSRVEPQLEWSSLEETMAAYERFLSGELPAKSLQGEDILLEEIFYGYKEDGFDEVDKYGFFDMNGDGIPELHLRSGPGWGLMIFTYRNQEVTFWYGGTVYQYSLDNRAVGYIRHGATPRHISYQYYVLDFWGKEQFHIDFAQYDADEDGVYDEQDGYAIEGEWVTKENWDRLTEPYLSVAPADMEWKQMSDYAP